MHPSHAHEPKMIAAFTLYSRKALPPFGWYLLRLLTRGWPGWVDLSGWSHTENNVPGYLLQMRPRGYRLPTKMFQKCIYSALNLKQIFQGACHRWRRGVAVECRTCDQDVAGSSLSWALRLKFSWQVSHTYVPLSPSSTTWYRSKGSCLATGEYRHYGLCVGRWQVKMCDPLVTHGPCLTSHCCPAWQLIFEHLLRTEAANKTKHICTPM